MDVLCENTALEGETYPVTCLGGIFLISQTQHQLMAGVRVLAKTKALLGDPAREAKIGK